MYVVPSYSSNPDNIFFNLQVFNELSILSENMKNCSKYYEVIRKMIKSQVVNFFKFSVVSYCIISACSNSITEVALIYNHVHIMFQKCDIIAQKNVIYVTRFSFISHFLGIQSDTCFNKISVPYGAVHKLCHLCWWEGGSPKDNLLHGIYLIKRVGEGVKN